MYTYINSLSYILYLNINIYIYKSINILQYMHLYAFVQSFEVRVQSENWYL